MLPVTRSSYDGTAIPLYYLSTSGYVYMGTSGHNQARRCLEKVRQVARQVFGRVHWNAAPGPGVKSAVYN